MRTNDRDKSEGGGKPDPLASETNTRTQRDKVGLPTRRA